MSSVSDQISSFWGEPPLRSSTQCVIIDEGKPTETCDAIIQLLLSFRDGVDEPKRIEQFETDESAEKPSGQDLTCGPVDVVVHFKQTHIYW